MKVKASVAAVLLAILMVAVGYGIRTTPASAEMDSPDFAIVKAGEYKELSTLRKLKLATSAYVNPDLYRTAEVAYVFDLSEFEDQSVSVLIPAMQSGDVWLGIASGDGESVKVSPVTTEDLDVFMTVGAHEISTHKAFEEWLETQQMIASKTGAKVKLVSKAEVLMGEPSIGAFVSWAPEQPVTEPISSTGLER